MKAWHPNDSKIPSLMNEYSFYIEIFAPQGLRGIEPYLADCRFPLTPYESGFNGQVILRNAARNEEIEFGMDPSTTQTMHASGFITHADLQEAWRMLESLSEALTLAGFPHWIGMDDPVRDRNFVVAYKCAGTVGPLRTYDV